MSHFTLAYTDEHMCWNLGCFSALLAAFVWREVASPTAFEKKTKQKIILKTTRYKVNLGDQQREKEQGN